MKCGICHEDVGATLAEVNRHRRDEHGAAANNRKAKDVDAPAPAPAADAPAPPQLDLDDDRPPEVAPNLGDDAVAPTVEPVKRGWRERLWGSGTREPKAPKPRGKRVPAGELLQGAWSLAGLGLIRSGVDAPVGRCLQYQAPVAGDVLDRVLADTAVDRLVLQPIARHADDVEVLGALVGLPALIFAYERANDELRMVLEPLLVEAIRAHLTAMVPVMRKRKARERELSMVVDDLRADGALPDDATTVDDAIRAVFAAMFQDAPPPAADDLADDRDRAAV